MRVLYVVGCRGTRFAKVGVSNKLGERLLAIQANCPLEIVKLRVYYHTDRRVANRCEVAMHQALRERHVRGEWFRLSDQDLEAMDSLAAQCGLSKAFSGNKPVPSPTNRSCRKKPSLPRNSRNRLHAS